MTLITPIKRSQSERIRLQAMAEKMYYDGYGAAEIASALDATLTEKQLPLSTREVERWIAELGWLRRAEPRRGERVTPEPPPSTPETWPSPFHESWMQ